jgi:hypothetical protein
VVVTIPSPFTSVPNRHPFLAEGVVARTQQQHAVARMCTYGAHLPRDISLGKHLHLQALRCGGRENGTRLGRKLAREVHVHLRRLWHRQYSPAKKHGADLQGKDGRTMNLRGAGDTTKPTIRPGCQQTTKRTTASTARNTDVTHSSPFVSIFAPVSSQHSRLAHSSNDSCISM